MRHYRRNTSKDATLQLQTRQRAELKASDTKPTHVTAVTDPIKTVRRAGGRGATSETSATWEMVQAVYGASLTADAKQVVTGGSDWDVVARRFLCWLATGTDRTSNLLIRVLTGMDDQKFNHAQASQMMLSALSDWTASLSSSGRFRPLTVANHGRSMAWVLERLSEMPGRPLLRFQRRALTMQTPKAIAHSLGSLAWPEAEGLTGAARERRCIEVVLDAAMQDFNAREAWFKFGQSILVGDRSADCLDSSAWAAVNALLTSEDHFWSIKGRSQFCGSGDCTEKVKSVADLLLDQKTWINAGLPLAAAQVISWNDKSLRLARLSELAMLCLGATAKATWSAMIAFCCRTGWNAQPMRDLPANPFLMRTDTDCGLATSAFVASFKRRARHDVLAYIDRDTPVSGLVEEDAKSIWRATAGDFDANGRQDGYTMIKKSQEINLLDLLDRYRTMTDATRTYDRSGEFRGRFFVHLTLRAGIRPQRGSISEVMLCGPLGRADLSFQAIRRSFISLTFRELGTVAATRVVAGQWSTSVLMPHYLNSDDIKSEMDQAVRLFQNILQGLVLEDREDASALLGVPDHVLRWFRRLGTVSGVAAAVGKTHPAPVGRSRRTLIFDPTYENLRDLFLTHWSLRQSQGRLLPRRWRVQGLPLLAAVKAVGKVMFSEGLGVSYLAAARRAHRELTYGSIALPPLVED